MSQIHPKIRRALACTALVSALSLLPAGDAAAQPLSRRAGAMEQSLRLAGQSLWDALARFLGKASVRIDPDGNKASVRIDPDGSALNLGVDTDGGNKASVRIDPDGNH